jgi:hypothetical protein
MTYSKLKKIFIIFNILKISFLLVIKISYSDFACFIVHEVEQSVS